MNISPDGFTVRFKTEPEEFFFAEKSGAKPNIVRILDVLEADQIKQDPPKKIIIQYEQEVFLRTLTHICIAGEALGKVIVIFSWDHAILDEKDLDHKAHIMRPNEAGEPPIDMSQTAILIPRTLIADLNWHRGKDSLPEFISKLLNDRIGGGR
jgi:hypothetical protein